MVRGTSKDLVNFTVRKLTTYREAVEAVIQKLSKFMLKAIPTDCSECPICLEEFRFGSEVRGLPCAHNFHVECIGQCLRLNVRCPRCRCLVFPNLDLTALSIFMSNQKGNSCHLLWCLQPSMQEPKPQAIVID